VSRVRKKEIRKERYPGGVNACAHCSARMQKVLCIYETRRGAYHIVVVVVEVVVVVVLVVIEKTRWRCRRTRVECIMQGVGEENPWKKGGVCSIFL